MKHDFSIRPEGTDADQYLNWLLSSTVEDLRQSHGDMESLKTSLFLLANRVCESKMPEANIAEVLGVSIVRAGYSESEEGQVFDIFEMFLEIAKASNSNDT